jgi:hypothetical protein
MVPPADQQTGRRGPQPYVPPVPPPPHQPAAPNRRRGTVLALVLGAVALLAVLVALVAVLTNLNGWSFSGEGASGRTGSAQEPQEPAPGDEAPEEPDEEAPGALPEGMSNASPDRMVQYRISGISCGLTEHNIRSRLPSTGQYCVVDLELFNASDELVEFDHAEQQMTTARERVSAQAPSVREVEAPLWDPAGIGPGATAEGELVFILRDGMEPRTLVLNHRLGAEATEIDIEHIVD